MGNRQQPWTFAEDRFGHRLRIEREKRGWTQAEVAERLEHGYGLKLHATAIAKMEQRNVEKPRTIRLPEAQAISDLFGLSVDEMMTSKGDSELVKYASRLRHLKGSVERMQAALDMQLEEFTPFLPLLGRANGMAPEVKEARHSILRTLAEVKERNEKQADLIQKMLAQVALSRYEDWKARYTPERAAELRKFGRFLRDARESAGVSVGSLEIATSSQIGIETVRKMEEGDFKGLELLSMRQITQGESTHLGILESAITAYAQDVGLDPEETLERYFAIMDSEPRKSRTVRVRRSSARATKD